MPFVSMSGQRVARRIADFLVASALTGAALLAGTGRAPAAEEAGRADIAVGEPQFAAIVRNVVERHIRPAAERLTQDAELLQMDLDLLCTEPGEPALADARRSFEATVRSMAALDGIRLGPLLEDNRLERLVFWPDPRGLALRQVQAVIAGKDETAADPSSLAGKSVAVQGLTALEFVLYGTGADALATAGGDGAFRCRYGAAIADNVARLSTEVLRGWEGSGAALLLEPGAANPLYRTHAEAAGAVFAAMATGLEIVAEQKLRTPLGESEKRARPKLSFFWRSGQTFPSIAATLEAIQHEFEVSGASDLLGPQEIWLANSIVFEAGNAARKAHAIDVSAETAFTDPVIRQQVKFLAIVASSLKRSIGREMTAALGLEGSFNALDGD